MSERRFARFLTGWGDFEEPFGRCVGVVLRAAVMWLAFYVPTLYLWRHL